MRNFLKNTLRIVSAASMAFALSTTTNALSATPISTSTNVGGKKAHAITNVSGKKIPALAATQTQSIMNATPTVAPGMDTLPLVQSQKAAAAAEEGQKDLADGDLHNAEAEFRISTELNAFDPDAVVGLAQTLEKEGKTEQAIKAYRYLLYPKQGWGTSYERDPLMRMRFALLLVNSNQWPEAVSVYENTISNVSIGPAYPSLEVHFLANVPQPTLFKAMAHLAIGVTYNGRLEHSEALPEYAAAIKAAPSLALAYYCYGHGLQRLGRRNEAAHYFEKAALIGDGSIKKAVQEELLVTFKP